MSRTRSLPQVAGIRQHIYVCGGCFLLGGKLAKMPQVGHAPHRGLAVLASMERFTPANREWKLMPPMSVGRYSATSLVMNGRFYVVGGSDQVAELRSAERFDPACNAWEELPAMAISRAFASSVQLHGLIYAIGGVEALKPQRRACAPPRACAKHADTGLRSMSTQKEALGKPSRRCRQSAVALSHRRCPEAAVSLSAAVGLHRFKQRSTPWSAFALVWVSGRCCGR